MRLPRVRFRACAAFWTSDQAEQPIELACPSSAETRAYVRTHGFAETLTLRLVRILLLNGETEVLLTTLLERTRYPAAAFKQVYGWRWHAETFFNRFKNIFEVERFSGTSPLALEQDICVVLLLANLESVLRQPDDVALQAAAQARANRTVPQVNRVVSYVALQERLIALLTSQRSHEEVLAELHHLFRTNLTRLRPDRQFREHH